MQDEDVEGCDEVRGVGVECGMHSRVSKLHCDVKSFIEKSFTCPQAILSCSQECLHTVTLNR